MGKKIGKLGLLLTDHKRDPKLDRIDTVLTCAVAVGLGIIAFYGLILR